LIAGRFSSPEVHAAVDREYSYEVITKTVTTPARVRIIFDFYSFLAELWINRQLENCETAKAECGCEEIAGGNSTQLHLIAPGAMSSRKARAGDGVTA
jgi:hypothetical protein